MTSGYIRFSVVGSVDVHGILKGSQDENSPVHEEHQPEFEQFVIAWKLRSVDRPRSVCVDRTPADIPDQLRKLGSAPRRGDSL